MVTYLALLRGLNVSGKNIIRMETLKKSIEMLGLTSVRTYIQSGNLVFKHPRVLNAELAKMISDNILENFGLNVPVVVKTANEIQAIIEENPFVALDIPVESLHVTFLSNVPGENLLLSIQPMNDKLDEAIARYDCIYLRCTHGYGRTRFTNTYFENRLKTIATTRNWKTILRLLEMTKYAENV
jgi:uncharacterized protein (DUF1697 family)